MDVPIRGLDASGKRCTNARAGADTDTALVERGGVRHTGKLVGAGWLSTRARQWARWGTYLELTGPEGLWRVINETASEVTLYTTDHVVVLCMSTLAKIIPRSVPSRAFA